MSINEVNGLFANGKMPGFEGVKIDKFFETDPILIDATAKVRTGKLIAEKEFYEQIKSLAVKDGEEVHAKLLGTDILKGFKFDKDTKDLIENSRKLFDNRYLNTVLEKYDSVLGMWKSAVTGFSPSFHARNAFANFISNSVEGLTDPSFYVKAMDVQAGKDGVFKTFSTGRQLTYKEIREQVAKHGIDQGFFTSETTDGLKELLKPSKNPAALTRQVGSAIEGNAKIAQFLYQLDKGKSANEAADVVKKVLFEYNELTPFERDVMKRVIPFYAWSRKNLPRQLEILGTKPQVYSQIAAAKSNVEGVAESESPLRDAERAAEPDYFKEIMATYIGDSPGKKKLFLSVGLPQLDLGRINVLNPDPKKSWQDNFIDTLGQFAGDLSPIFKAGLEAAFNRNMMRPTSGNLTVDKAKQYVPVPEFLGLAPDVIQKAIGVKRDTKNDKLVMPTLTAIAINNLLATPQLRVAGKVGGSSSVATEEEKLLALMSFFTGVKVVPVDIKKEAVKAYKYSLYERRDAKSDKKRFKEIE